MINNRLLFLVNVDWFFISHRLPIALEAIKRNYEVHIACGITDRKKYLENLGLIVHPLNISRSGSNILNEIKTFIDILEVLRKVDASIVHFITIKPIIYGGIISRFLNINKKVFSISGLGFIFIAKGIKAFIIRFIIKILYKIALGGKNSIVIVQNINDKNIILKIQKVLIILIKGSGVDLSIYKYINESIVPNITVTMASRLLKDKGVFEYIEAAKIIKQKGLNVEFELYGDIDDGNPATLTKNDLQNIKDNNYLKLYEFSDEISKIFINANIVVLPSYREGLPKVLIEAAACGRAVVTTNVPGCRDAIKPNITGLLCNVKDAKSLAEQIEKIILDNDLRINMGKEARKLAEEEFDIDKVVNEHFKIYENII